MTNYHKANIRLDRVRQRQLKTSYAHLTPPQKRWIKLLEQAAELEKSVDNQWRVINQRQPPPYLPHNTPPEVQEMLDLVQLLEKNLSRCYAATERHVKKHGIDEQATLSLHRQVNTHSTSF